MSGAHRPSVARHHGLDWLRIGAFGLLILYHVGMVFVPWGWHVKATVTPDWTTLPMILLNPWRLALLFLVSGYASRALLARLGGAGRFAWGRIVRLGPPLAFGVAVIVPPQAWIELRESGRLSGGYLDFWLRDWFAFGTRHGAVLPAFNHLWFVAYLLIYTLALALLVALVPGRARRWAQIGFDGLFGGWRVLAMPLAWLALVRFVLVEGRLETHGLIDDLPGHLFFLPAFLFGFGLGGAERLWPAIRRWWPGGLALGLVGYAMMAVVEARWPGYHVPPHDWRIVARIGRWLMGWGPILALLGIADRWWRRDGRWRATLAEAVFPFYLLHQTVIVVVAWWLKPAGLPIGVQFLILVAATSVSCAAFYLVGRRVGWLRPLIGLKRKVPA